MRRPHFLLLMLIMAAVFITLLRDARGDIAVANANVVRITGLCDDWIAYRTQNDLFLTCKSQRATLPAGAIELRESYVVGDRLP